MNTETETTEQDEQLLEVLTEWASVWPDPDEAATEAMKAMQPTLAAIRRHAAAQALREAARSTEKIAAFMRQQQNAVAAKGDELTATLYGGQADARYSVAHSLRRAAADTIAEGYEHTCAARFEATRADPGYDCDARVENEGDFCPGHEPADDDPWAD